MIRKYDGKKDMYQSQTHVNYGCQHLIGTVPANPHIMYKLMFRYDNGQSRCGFEPSLFVS